MNILEIHYLPRVCLTHRISLISLSKAGQFFTHFFVQEAGYLVKEKFSFGDSWMAEILYLLLCHCACVLSLRSLQIIFTELLAWLHITSSHASSGTIWGTFRQPNHFKQPRPWITNGHRREEAQSREVQCVLVFVPSPWKFPGCYSAWTPPSGPPCPLKESCCGWLPLRKISSRPVGSLTKSSK